MFYLRVLPWINVNPVKTAVFLLGRYHKKVSFIMTFLGNTPLIFINHGLAKSGVDIKGT
jgi:hypothetical protein